MKKIILMVAGLFALVTLGHGQSLTAITYQGRLALGGQPANGYYDFKFSLHATSSGGGPVANTIAKPPIFVTNGLFTTTLDFGAAGFPGDKRWLEIAVRPTGGNGNYETLAPRQRITATPYALEAATVADGAVTASKLSPGAGPEGQVLRMSGGQLAWGTGGAGGVSSVGSGLGLTGGPITSTGTLAIDTAVVPRLNVANAFSHPGNSFVGSFAGNGASITNLNASNITSGTLNDARLSANVALRNAHQTFSGSNAFTGVASFTSSTNRFVGTFIGNGAGLTNLTGVAGTNYNGASITNLNASNIASGTLNDARLSANVALRNANQAFTGANTFGNGANSFVGSFNGNGTSVTNLSASNLASGTVNDARLSANVALRNAQQTFTGSNTFTGVASFTSSTNRFVGTFFGNGAGLSNLSVVAAPNYNGAAITNLNAANLASGTLNDARLSANVALRNAQQTFTGSNTFTGVASLTNAANRFVGTFSGDGGGLANINASFTNSLVGDVTGPPSATTVGRLRGVNVSATGPAANQVLRYNGSAWAPGAVALGTDVSGTLPVASGGSGQSSYTIGDLLYANGAASLAKLSDVVTGNALISGGIGVAPLWGKVGLTTHVSGTLPVANGGSGATTATTARSNLGAAASGANSDITALNGLTTPLAASRGGSGFSSFTTGDLLFANSASSLARLADVVSGNVLLSGGIGVAPLWGKVILTTHVTGALPVANGGTGGASGAAALSNLGGAASGANADITSLAGLTTPLSATQGGSGQAGYATGDLLFASSASTLARRAIGGPGQVLTAQSGVPIWTNANVHNHFGQVWTGATVDGLYVQNTSLAEGASSFAGIVTGLTNVNYGVFGQTESSQGTGVQGLALASSGLTAGVAGEAGSTDGIGVYGVATAITGTNVGVLGESSSPLGSGVSGQALATTGSPIGVYGYSAAANGYGFYTPSRLYVGNNAFVGGHLTMGVGSRVQADAGTTNLPGITFFGNTGTGLFSPATNVLGFATSGNQRLRVAADGKIGVGRSAATNRFEVEGEASKTTAGGWLANSDAAIKTEIHTVSGALNKIGQVRPVAFRYAADYLHQHPDIEDKVYYNVIAQEFAQVFPDAVKASGEKLNGRDILQVDTYPAIIVSIAAIQELRGAVQARDRELTELRNQNQKLEARLNAIEQHLAAKAR